MVDIKERSFLFGAGLSAGAAPKRRFVFYLWNFGMLALSAAGICALTLQLGIGMYAKEVFFDYFRHPLIFFLNFLPIFLFELLMYCLIGRVWAAFLSTAVIFVTAAAGNYFKLVFRGDPFMFADISAIHTALGVSSEYDIGLNKRIVLCLLCVAAGTAILFFFVRGRISGRSRLVLAALTLLSVWPLWSFVYSSSDIYNNRTQNYEHINRWVADQLYMSKGFVYPFIYSIKSAVDTPPDGYDEQTAAGYLSEYSDSDIPDDRKVNILALQLEAFSDFTTLGLDELEYIYADYHALEDESYTGDLITNVFAGGTVDTERCFLTGYTRLRDYRQNTNSYVWYLRQQGYTVNGSHPSYRSFYNRFNVNSYLGFEDYLYTEGYYDEYSSSVSYDDVLFPEMLRLFTEDVSSGKPVFSFNVSYQGHGPYSTDRLDWGDPLWEGDVSDYSYYVMNNYLGSVKDTISRLCELKAELEAMDEPVVLVVYGDHKPWLGDGSSVYAELGVELDTSTLSGFMNYYSTRYLIWANDAAKELTGCDFIGEGPDISPCYLMNELFSLLGWEGPAYMKFMNDAESMLPVINSKGLYPEDRQIVDSLEGEALSALERVDFVQYYLRKNFLYQEVIS